MVEFLRPRVAGEQIEQLGQILAEGLPASEQTEVAIDAGCARVVIASGEVAIPSNAVGFLPHHQTDFAVGFISHHAVDDMGADFFQNGHFLACFGGAGQRLSDERWETRR